MTMARIILSTLRRTAVLTLVGVCFLVWLITIRLATFSFSFSADQVWVEETLSLLQGKDNQKTLVICAIAKNENRYLEEWLDYNIALGFDHIYLYDNSDDFDIKPFLKRYPGKHKVTLFHLPGLKKQIPAYQSCATLCREKNVTRILFVDTDEFLVLKRHDSIHDFCRTFKNNTVFNHLVFGSGGYQSYLPLPVTMRFRCVIPSYIFEQKFFKSMLYVRDLDIEKIYDPHRFPLLNNTWAYDVLGRPIPPEGPWIPATWKIASLYHYSWKSHEEFVGKISRGDVFYGNFSANPNVTKPPGKVYEETAWRHLQRLVPKYLKYDDHPLAKNLSWPCLPSEEAESQAFSNT